MQAEQRPRGWVSSVEDQRELLRVERMFLDIERARRDLENSSALVEMQAGWCDPLLPFEDPTNL